MTRKTRNTLRRLKAKGILPKKSLDEVRFKAATERPVLEVVEPITTLGVAFGETLPPGYEHRNVDDLTSLFALAVDTNGELVVVVNHATHWATMGGEVVTLRERVAP